MLLQECVPPEPLLPCCELLTHSPPVLHSRRMPVNSCLASATNQDLGLHVCIWLHPEEIHSVLDLFFNPTTLPIIPTFSPPLDENGHISARWPHFFNSPLVSPTLGKYQATRGQGHPPARGA